MSLKTESGSLSASGNSGEVDLKFSFMLTGLMGGKDLPGGDKRLIVVPESEQGKRDDLLATGEVRYAGIMQWLCHDMKPEI